MKDQSIPPFHPRKIYNISDLTKAQLNAAGAGIKREQPEAEIVRASSEERHVKRLRTGYAILVEGVEVVDLVSDDE